MMAISVPFFPVVCPQHGSTGGERKDPGLEAAKRRGHHVPVCFERPSMPPFFRLIAAAAAALLLPIAASAAGLPVAKKVVRIKNADAEISVSYPLTGNKAIDATIKDYANASVAEFRGDASAHQRGERPYAFETTYDIARNDGKMFAVIFSIYTDMNGAHPNGDYKTFNFTLPGGEQVFLPEIVDGQPGLDRVSKLAIARLKHDIGTGENAMSDADWIDRGAGPFADSFKNFVWLPDRLRILFPAYQVAAYAAGPQEVSIPLAQLKGVIRSDWRAPAASFDCRKAETVIEHTICANFALARLDRQVAETYWSQMHNAYEDSEKNTLKSAQRDFLFARNASCGRAPDIAGCLTKAYRNRLAVLNKPAQ
jgi:uncharacterized protein YecT (DUF1311 family)